MTLRPVSARWFEILLLLFCIALVVNIVKYRFVQQKKWSLLIFHAAIIIIIIGSGATRYFGYEGMMHIREGNVSNVVYSSKAYLSFQAKVGDDNFLFNEPFLVSSFGDNSFKETYEAGSQPIEIEIKNVIPNPVKSIVATDNGLPTLKIVYGGSGSREEYFLQEGQQKHLFGILFNFKNEEEIGRAHV